MTPFSLQPSISFAATRIRLFLLCLLVVLIGFCQILSGAEVTLAWDANPEPDIAGYRIHYGTEAGVYPTSVEVGNATTATVTGLAEATTHFFVVTALNTQSLESLPSEEVSAHTGPAIIAAPNSLVAHAADREVSLDWADHGDADLASYTVYRSLSSGSGFEAIAAGLITSDYVDSTVSNGTMYYYVVTATNAGGTESSFSNEVSAKPMDMSAPLVNLSTGSVMVSGDFDVAIVFSEAITGLTLTDFEVGGGSASSMTGGSVNYTATIAPTNPGAVSVKLPAGAVNDVGGNGNFASNELAVTYEPPVLPTSVWAIGETAQTGTIVGTFGDLRSFDNQYQILTEVESGGKRSRRYSRLSHVWTFDVTGSNPILHVGAFHTVSGDGDDFVFSCSVDGSTFTDVITVTKTVAEHTSQTASLGNVSGTVMIRVEDTNHSRGSNIYFDSLYVDALYIETDSGAPGVNVTPAFDGDPVEAPDAVQGQAYASTLAVRASDSDGDSLTFSRIDGPAWLTVDADGTLGGIPAATDHGENRFTVEVNDGRGGTARTTLVVRVVTEVGTLDLFVSNIDMAYESYSRSRFRASATITIKDQTGLPVPGATVSFFWSGATSENGVGVTDFNGVIAIQSRGVKHGGTFSVTVSDVAAAGFRYDSTLNVETGDSITAR